jgi:hypothetical protein
MDKPKLAEDTLNCLCRDAHAHSQLATAAGPATASGFDFEAIFQLLWPYILQAIQALVSGGVPAPTAVQVMAKAHELAAAAGP